ncbi:flagellar biosynthetic protein FliO [Afifella sp. IM 167]|uniref:flagellar biosynthetic protein FliO n=1 Tax=Afifella sp. IM 167 TaxID=2033586 RepID=UPI001CCF89AF|nr:flagellar biosynthetic protein FliO [Afifella sp. IM 167]MBZ8134719.1 hypothetical protein [Afifella sp. IM 167]
MRGFPGLSEGGLSFAIVLALLVVLAVFVGYVWLSRRSPSRVRAASGSRNTRLQVMEIHTVDQKRRLLLVRRDQVEHLVMIGGPTDIVVESHIVRGRPGQTQPPPRRVAPMPAAPAAPAAAQAPMPARAAASVHALEPREDRRGSAMHSDGERKAATDTSAFAPLPAGPFPLEKSPAAPAVSGMATPAANPANPPSPSEPSRFGEPPRALKTPQAEAQPAEEPAESDFAEEEPSEKTAATTREPLRDVLSSEAEPPAEATADKQISESPTGEDQAEGAPRAEAAAGEIAGRTDAPAREESPLERAFATRFAAEMAQREPPQTESPKAESPKAEAPPPESPKSETPRTETSWANPEPSTPEPANRSADRMAAEGAYASDGAPDAPEGPASAETETRETEGGVGRVLSGLFRPKRETPAAPAEAPAREVAIALENRPAGPASLAAAARRQPENGPAPAEAEPADEEPADPAPVTAARPATSYFLSARKVTKDSLQDTSDPIGDLSLEDEIGAAIGLGRPAPIQGKAPGKAPEIAAPAPVTFAGGADPSALSVPPALNEDGPKADRTAGPAARPEPSFDAPAPTGEEDHGTQQDEPRKALARIDTEESIITFEPKRRDVGHDEEDLEDEMTRLLGELTGDLKRR